MINNKPEINLDAMEQQLNTGAVGVASHIAKELIHRLREAGAVKGSIYNCPICGLNRTQGNHRRCSAISKQRQERLDSINGRDKK